MEFLDAQLRMHSIRARDFSRFSFRRLSCVAKRLILPAIAVLGTLTCVSTAEAGAPAMIVPGQFNVSNTGAFTYTIPIVVPPGTAGMVPALSLDYSSQNLSDGLEGWGWTLSGLPSITRCPQTIAQDSYHGAVNYDSNDRFCLEGQRLIAVNGSYGANGTAYRTEIDGFSRIFSYVSGGSLYFQVQTKAGQTMEFGHTADSQGPIIAANCTYPTTPTCTMASGATSLARVWAVDRITDTKGNYLTVTYNNGTPDTVNGEMYPTEIDYTGNSNTHSSPYNSVQFVYESRLDTSTVYQAGGVVSASHLLSDVVTYSGAAVVHDYRLCYATGCAAAGSGSATPSSSSPEQLLSVSLCDGTGSGANCLAPTSFVWRGGLVTNPTQVSNPLHGAVGAINKANNSADFNGDGLTDVIQQLPIASTTCGQSAPQSIYYGTRDGHTFTGSGLVTNYTGHATTLNCNALNVFTTDGGVETLPLDIDGDGIADVLTRQYEGTWGNSSQWTNEWYELQNDSQTTLTSTIFRDLGNATPFAGDFNGDGISDLYVLNNDFMINTVDGSGNVTLTDSGEGLGTLTTGDTQSIYPEDFDGDGCTDILAQGNTSRLYSSPFCGETPPSVAIDSGLWHAGYTPTFGDFNGDGKMDVLWTNSSDYPRLWLSTGTGFQQIELGWTPPHDSIVVAGDFNGDGKTDIAFVYKTGSLEVFLSTGTDFVDSGVGDTFTNPGGISAYEADWNSDGGPDLWLQFEDNDADDVEELFSFVPISIASVQNGIGVTTSVTYDRINNQDSSGNPTVYTKCPSTPTTFKCNVSYPSQAVDGPLYVVQQIASSNGIGTGNYSSTYTYGGGITNLQGRGFQGFSLMTVTDLQTGIVQTTKYLTSFPYTGMVSSQTKVCPAGSHCQSTVTLSSTTNTYEDLPLGSGSATRQYVQLTKSVVTSAELDGTAGPKVTTTYQSDCDTASSLTGGNPCFGDMTSVAVQTADPSGTVEATKTTTSTFTDDTTNWFLGRLLSANVSSIAYGIHQTRTTSYCYDLSYTPAGTSCVATTGTPSGLLTQEIVEPGNPTATNTLETDTVWSSYGNKASVSVTGCLTPSCPSTQTRTTSMTYDSTNHQYLWQTTNALGEEEAWAPSLTAPATYNAFGEPLNHTGPNGLTTIWTYDTFGRAHSETRPDGTQTKTTYNYCSGVNGGFANCPANGAFESETWLYGKDGTTQIGPDTIVFYDSLSRAIGKSVQGFNGCWTRTDTIYDAKGRISQTDRPYFTGAGSGSCSTQSPAYTTYSYVIAGTSVEDALGRAQKITLPNGTDGTPLGWTTFVYTNTSGGSAPMEGPLATVTVSGKRPNGSGVMATYNEATSTQKDYLGRVYSVVDPLVNETDYAYNAFDNLNTITDPNGNITSYSYDIRGRKTKSVDPDMETWTYVYDSFGELYQQTDPVDGTGNPITMTYDKLGRMTQRVEPDPTNSMTGSTATSTWTYGTASNQTTYPNSIDKLVVAACSGTVCKGSYARTYTFDGFGRQRTLSLAIGSLSVNNTLITYDSNTGKISTVQSFSGFTVDYGYNGIGYLSTLTDDLSGVVYWQANSEDAELHVTQETAGNGVITQRNYDPNLGYVDSIAAGSSAHPTNIANFSYTWDPLGDLTSRTDMLAVSGGQSENFCYDALNRLKYSAIATGSGSDCNSTGDTEVDYDVTGNITFKSGVGSYSYGGTGPHAVSYVNTPAGTTLDGIHNPSFTYDANGNMLCVLAAGQTCALSSATRFVTYTAFDMTSTITQGTTSSTFNYDPEHNRMFRRDVAGGATTNTVYWNDPVANVVNERIQTGSVYTWKNYIKVGGQLIALRTTVDGAGTFDTKYFVTDHLGSVSVVTDGNSGDSNYGQVITGGRLFYDAWGKMRNNDGSADTTCGNPQAAQSATGSDRTFTAQESMPAYCLLNYNARLYDPALGRFLSADPTTEAIYNLQDLNRYSYVLNNPLSLNDPTGYGGFFGKGSLGIALVGIAAAAMLEFELLPLIEGTSFGALTALANPGVSAAVGLPGVSAQAGTLLAINSGIAGGISGAITSGTLKGALMGGLEAGAFYGVGNFLQGDSGLVFGSQTADAALAHGMVGGLFSIGQKGGFGSGFLAAGLGSVADDVQVGPVGDTVVHAVAGGVGSILGGGKFANGAVTGAFGYLFNDLPHSWGNQVAVGGAVVGGVAVSGVCDFVSDGTCIPANEATYAAGAAAGAGIGYAMGYGAGAVADKLDSVVHGNSADSMRGTEVYYLINNSTGAIDKIGITSNSSERYSQAYLKMENVTYVPQTQYQWRYAAMVDENIRLTHYYIDYGQLPRLNQNFH